MQKPIFKIIAFLLPILFVYGIFRWYASGSAGEIDFLPQYSTLLSAFASAPDWGSIILEDLARFDVFAQNGVEKFELLKSYEITDIGSFFSYIGAFFGAIGEFVNYIGNFFVMIFHAVATPFKAIAWFISVFIWPEGVSELSDHFLA